ncbi:MAG TPA: hypothetical protein VHX88_06670 [Solirubrobacteraceae bacterium]|nr:hypothetical protein [Solirubrobacteraceae bacterium]
MACIASVAGAAGALAGLPASSAAAALPLSGTLRVATGSTFQVVLPGGGSSGPFLPALSLTDPLGSSIALTPGSAGGLATGRYQPSPAILAPTPFLGTSFQAATVSTDPQTGAAVPAPSITTDGNGHLSADLRAWSISWNHQSYEQGSADATGTYDVSTGAFTLNWVSPIQGGLFNGFSGDWHLVGTFVPASIPSTTPPAPAPTAAPPTTHRVIPQIARAAAPHPTSFAASDSRWQVQTGFVVRLPKGGQLASVAVTATIAGGSGRGELVGTRLFEVRPGASGSAWFILNPSAVGLLRSRGSLPLRFQIIASSPNGTVTRHGTTRLTAR